MEKKDSVLKIKVTSNGPLLVDGKIDLIMADGSTVTKDKAALCRCGASNNKPYCDGSHVKIEFKG
ncbi:MAG: CDGSH iron-sulfur domain-containing protein [Prevotella sp.]|jgi:CDGSH-type Zn-finger protein|nr:CDGSH iron-sulfur domain-containing protein [Prevotella sp.]